MVLGMLFENFKNYYILRYVIYEFLKKVLGGPQPTCLVRVFCAPPAWRVTFNERKTVFCSWHHYFTCLTLVNSMKLQAIRMNRF